MNKRLNHFDHLKSKLNINEDFFQLSQWWLNLLLLKLELEHFSFLIL